MIYADIKTLEERIRLKDALKAAKDKNWYRRLQVIELSAEKYSVQELCDTFKLCEATIRNYIHSYNDGGLDKLALGKSPGRPPKIGNWTKKQWDEVLEQTPNQYKKLNTQSRQWTLERLRQYVKEYHGIVVCLSSIHNSLMKGRRTGRSKLRVGSPDPMYTVKRGYTKGVQNLHSRDN